tara:strand:+ start:1073 stop:2446 length:1374 start_codon:yes stop_codon:yes gene_type:complete
MSGSEYIEPPEGNFEGYEKSTRPAADAFLTRVGPGTPCGEYWRRFWFPVAMTQEVTDLPLRIRILGEDLVLFRDGSSRYGLLQLHCSHRNTSLEFGLIEERGISCCYHGWHYDIDGTILATPGDADSNVKDRARHGAYPVIEYKGLVFAYMGPPDEMPVFPVFDSFELPDVEMVPYSITMPCNWLQVAENTMDPMHAAFLHSRERDMHFASTWGELPFIEWYDHDWKMNLTMTRRLGDTIWVTVQETVYPANSTVGYLWEEGTEEKYFTRVGFNKWTVPHDDTHCMVIAWRHFGDIDVKHMGKPEQVGKQSVDFPGQTGTEPYDERQRNPNDFEAQVGQGPISVHASENLVAHDQGVALLRKHIREGIEAVQRGERVPSPPQDGSMLSCYAQNTVLPIPIQPNTDDDQLLRNVAKAVFKTVASGDGYAEPERTAHIRDELRKLPNESRFLSSLASAG